MWHFNSFFGMHVLSFKVALYARVKLRFRVYYLYHLYWKIIEISHNNKPEYANDLWVHGKDPCVLL